MYKKTLYKKECPVCKQNFMTTWRVKKYCSKECLRKIDRIKYGKIPSKIPLIKCRVCNNIIKIRNRKVYCSDNCEKIYLEKKRKMRKEKLEYGYSSFTKYRFEILKRDKFRCIYCGKLSIEDGIKLHIEHIIPRIKTNLKTEEETKERLVTSCITCNYGKSTNELEKDIIERIIKRNKYIAKTI